MRNCNCFFLPASMDMFTRVCLWMTDWKYVIKECDSFNAIFKKKKLFLKHFLVKESICMKAINDNNNDPEQ